jgi:LEA14-like dessication related protein
MNEGISIRLASRAAGVVLLAGLIGGCALFYRNPTVQIADVRVIGLGFTSGTAEVLLRVENPNFFQLEVHEFEYVLEIEDRYDRWRPLAEGRSEERVRLPRRSTETVTLEIPFSYEALGVALRSWWDTGEVTYRIEGDLIGRGPTGGMNLPFRASGQMRPSLD